MEPRHREVFVEYAKDGAEFGAFMMMQHPSWAGLDWRHMTPNWLAARWDDRIVGALQLHFGKPIGRLEDLFLDRELGRIQRGVVVIRLLEAGREEMRRFGSSVIFGAMSEKFSGLVTALKNRGVRTTGKAEALMWRLR